MRNVSFAILAALSLAGPSLAFAADLDDDFLRGPDYDPPSAVAPIDWSGVYLGGHGGYSSAALGFKNAYQQTLADYFRARDIETEFGVSTLLTAPSRRVGGMTFGAFAGYNVQFGEIVLGVEGDYTRFDSHGFSSNDIARRYLTAGGMSESVYLSGLSRTDIQDFGTIRARAGYAMGSFLPFVTGGLAIGRATIYDQIGVQNYGYDKKTYDANQQSTNGKTSYVENHGYASFDQNDISTATPAGVINLPAHSKVKTVGGITLGGGLEYAITPSILLRGEYQYVLFNDFDGHKANVNTVRGGAAVKF